MSDRKIPTGPMTILCAAKIEAANDNDGANSIPKVSMVAYTGGKIDLNGWGGTPLVVDLGGLSFAAHRLPIRLEHDKMLGLGHTEKWNNDGKTLECTGLISRDTEAAREVIAASKNGFPWQASIGAKVKEAVYVPEKTFVKANGQTFEGPLYHCTQTEIFEVSLTELGADTATSAQIAASAALEAQTIMPDPIVTTPATVTATATPSNQPLAPATNPNEIEAMRIQAAANVADETNRIAAINALPDNGHPKIKATAIKEGWTPEKAELTILRAARPTAPSAHIIDGHAGRDVIECAFAQATRLPSLEKDYKPEILEAAHRQFKGRIGIQQALIAAARQNGWTGDSMKGNERAVIRAAFSTGDISGILSNIANKFLLNGFFMAEQTWRKIASIRPVNDFKTITSYRLTGGGSYQKIAPGGKIKHGTLGNESYTNKADSYGLMLSIDRQDIINDDLGALATVPQVLGRGSGTALNEVFWTAFLDDSAFFTSGNANYQVGATASLLTIDGLTNAEVLFMNLLDANGQIIGHEAKTLLVPPALAAQASVLMKSTEMRNTTASTKEGTANPHAGKFEVATSRYLSRTTIAGATVTGSSTAWYLLGSPMDVPVIEVALLNGNESPIIETAQVAFDELGIQMRGYHDFGVAKQDYRGGVKSKGAA